VRHAPGQYELTIRYRNMFKTLFYFVIPLTICLSCENRTNKTERQFQQIYLNDPDSGSTPTVLIPGLTFVTDNLDLEKNDALEILKLKHSLPLAMQTKNRDLFEGILARGFTFRAENEFFNRADYINNRVSGTWTIDTVKFENLVLQLFDNKALLTYKNTLRGTDDKGEADIEKYSWADIYIKQGDSWRVLGIHEIDSRIEYFDK